MAKRLGIVGGGQLGRMLALAAVPLGIECTVLDPSADAPARLVARHIRAAYDDSAALAALAAASDVVTYEFEHLPISAIRRLAAQVPVSPSADALAIVQDRITQKEFLDAHQVPIAPWAPVRDAGECTAAAKRIGAPGVLKTARDGYDGKGQRVVREAGQLAAAWAELGQQPCVYEGFVRFEREVSLLSVRGTAGIVAAYPLVENVHRDGILRLTTAPAAGITTDHERQAAAITHALLDHWEYVGVLTVELFDVQGRLVVNELAPRVHNSGHWSIEGAVTSQFANHVRAVCGLPLGSCAARQPSAMLNCIGTMPETAAILAIPGAQLHDYGKVPRAGRKLGHVTVTAADAAQCAALVARLAPLVP